jgi:release factor glutamine methyltransferase
MHAPFKQQWMASVAAVLGTEEADACFRTYVRWLEDHKLPLQQPQMKEVMDRLTCHEPVQYILGEAWFYGLPFHVNRNTLIPRPETEELCELIIKNNPRENLNLLDVGTGSGCIPIALLHINKSWTATALDINRGALDTAKKNAETAGVSDRIQFEYFDFTADYNDSIQWDLIVSNPPYIDRKEQNNLKSNVIDWEPHAALFPEGDDPLIFYKKLADLLLKQKSGCELWAEINSNYSVETLSLFDVFVKNELVNDMSGNLRFLHAVK